MKKKKNRLPIGEMLRRDLRMAYKTVILGVYPEVVQQEEGIHRHLVSRASRRALVEMKTRYNIPGAPTVRDQRQNRDIIRPFFGIYEKELKGEPLTPAEFELVKSRRLADLDPAEKAPEIPNFIPADQCDGPTLVKQALVVLENLTENLRVWLDQSANVGNLGLVTAEEDEL